MKLGKCYPKSIQDINDDNFDNRRDFFRINFKKPLGADMSIFKIGGKKVSLGYAEVVVFDISAGGLRFLSEMKLPVKSDVVFEYGLEFVFDEKHREAMLQLLNQLQGNIKNKRGVDNYRLVKRVYIK